MEYRAEPRFPVRSPIRVIVPGDPARILNGDLIDVSGTGMRFLSDEQLTPDEIVAIEVDSRLVLAEIRYCQTRGYKFVVGVKRLQEIAKSAELKDSGACATEMIRDLRRHISAGGEGDPQALAMKALERIVERGEVSPDGHESKPESNHATTPGTYNVELLPPEPIPPQPVLNTTVDRVETLAIASPNPRELDETPLQERAGTVPRGVIDAEVIDAEVIHADVIHPDVIHADVIEGDVIGGVIGGGVLRGTLLQHRYADPPVADLPAERESAGIQSQASVVAEQPATTPAAPVASVPLPVRAPTSPDTAREADPLAARRAEMEATYLAAEAAGTPVRHSPSWRIPVGIAAALVLACAIAFFLMQRRTQATPLAPPIEVHPAEVAPSPVPASPSVPHASIPAPGQTPAKKAEVHHVEIKVADPSWIGIVADGGKLFQTVLHKGDVHKFDYSKNAVLRLGHAAGTVVTLDGAPVGPLKGTVLLLQFTPQGVRFQ